jgi:hypothetical protein
MQSCLRLQRRGRRAGRVFHNCSSWPATARGIQVKTEAPLNTDSAAPEDAALEAPSSRRDFLRNAVVGVSLAGALPAVAMSTPVPAPRKNRAIDPIEEVLQRYGGEFGPITRID